MTRLVKQYGYVIGDTGWPNLDGSKQNYRRERVKRRFAEAQVERVFIKCGHHHVRQKRAVRFSQRELENLGQTGTIVL